MNYFIVLYSIALYLLMSLMKKSKKYEKCKAIYNSARPFTHSWQSSVQTQAIEKDHVKQQTLVSMR